MEKKLNLTLKKKWFDMIASGVKKEEYREIKPYWINRLCWHEYHNLPKSQIMWNDVTGKDILKRNIDIVSANNGYAKNCPNVTWKHEGIRIGKPNPEWCEPEDVDQTVFILSIGEIISKS